MPKVAFNQYGKAEVRMVAVNRDAAAHTFDDLTVGITLSGDLEAVHTEGDNAHVVATDTQKNTVFAFAREHGVGAIEDFGLRLARHFVSAFDPITRARVHIQRANWDRLSDIAFTAAGQEARTATVVCDSGGEWVVSGLENLVVLKTTGSEFHGFIEDRYTTLKPTDDRILATAVKARWRHAGVDADWDASFTAAREAALAAFAATHSLSLQQTLYAMASGIIATGAVEVRMSMPNKHHFLQDLSPFGLDNPNEIYRAEDRPYGLIEACVEADDMPPAGPAWDPYPLI